MYKHTVRIPRVTPTTLALLNDLVPGLNAFVTIPTLMTEREVRAHVTEKYNRELPRYEYVREITEAVVENNTHWRVTMIISGD